RSYARSGASVLLTARDARALEEAESEVRALAGPGQSVTALAADLVAEGSPERLVATALEQLGGLHVLVNNAGVLGPLGPLDDVDWSEWVHAVEVNLLAPARLCRAAVGHFRSQRYGKIVQLSGGGATAPAPNRTAYAASKAAVVRLIETLAVETRDLGIDANAIAPGALNTGMLDELLEAGPDRIGQALYEQAVKQRDSGGASLEAAARLAVFFGSAASDGISGRLVSAVWDPWESLGERRDQLASGDVYTLRRIVPEDRGQTWS